MDIVFRSNKSKAIGVIAALIIAACMFILPPEYLKGSARAWLEWKMGRMEIKTWGYEKKPLWDNDYKTLLSNKYQVYIHSLSTGTPSFKDRRYYEGYNDMMMRFIIKKYGKDIFEECQKEAEASYTKRTNMLQGSGVHD